MVTVSRQLGHARPSITLDVYSHEFATVHDRDSIEAKLAGAFSGILAAESDKTLTNEGSEHSEPSSNKAETAWLSDGSDGTRTRDLRRDRPAF